MTSLFSWRPDGPTMQSVQLIARTSMPMYLATRVLRGGKLGLNCNLYSARALLPALASAQVLSSPAIATVAARNLLMLQRQSSQSQGPQDPLSAGFERHHPMML